MYSLSEEMRKYNEPIAMRLTTQLNEKRKNQYDIEYKEDKEFEDFFINKNKLIHIKNDYYSMGKYYYNRKTTEMYHIYKKEIRKINKYEETYKHLIEYNKDIIYS